MEMKKRGEIIQKHYRWAFDYGTRQVSNPADVGTLSHPAYP
jgi:hypothetical protein